jgi:type II secretory pathway component PulF
MFEAFSTTGTVVKGEIEARSQGEAVQQLRTRGLIPFAAQPVLHGKASFWRLENGLRRVKAEARVAFVYELGILLKAQLPIDQALRLLARQPELKKLGPLLESIAEAVAGGRTLGEAVTVHPELLKEHEAAMIRGAEHTGSAADMLLQIAASMRRQMELRSRLKSAISYPVILLMMSFFTIAIIATVLVPNLLPLFEGSRAVRPFIITAFVVFNEHIEHLVIATTMLIMIGWGSLHRLRSNETAIALKDRLLLRLPVIGPLMEGAETARTASSLGLLLKSGIPLLQTLSIAQRTCKNRVVRVALGNAAERVASGARLASALSEFAVMPETACHLVSVGEEANRVDELMLHVAQMSETAVQQQLDRLMTFLTPVLTLAMGFLVAGLIMSVMRAILSVNDLALQ